ncbi:MAG: hypothetical protein IJ703_08855 [Eubacterium sp.]|nr:hypothetical protein [Eubacterium sp.]
MSNSIDLYNVLKSAKEALFEELSKYPIESYKQDIVIDNDCCFRTIIEWEKCMGELIIEEAEFAPYRYISFNILSSIIDEITPIFYWYDSENDSLETIINRIKEGVLIAFKY